MHLKLVELCQFVFRPFQGSAGMFAVFEDGNRQYKVRQGDVLAVDFRNEAQDGEVLTFNNVLIANGGGASVVGRPLIDGAAVTAKWSWRNIRASSSKFRPSIAQRFAATHWPSTEIYSRQNHRNLCSRFASRRASCRTTGLIVGFQQFDRI